MTLKRISDGRTAFSTKIKDREGQDLDQNELSVPFGYKLLNLSSGLRFRLYKSNRTFVKLNYSAKNFDDSSTRSVMYHLYRIHGEFKNIKWRNHLLHSYGVRLGYTSRNYEITNFSDDSRGDRTWNYLDVAVFYKLPINKQWTVEPEVSYQKRTDKTNTTFGYSQFRPELTLSYESAKFEAQINTSYTKRSFNNLTAQNSNNQTVGKLSYDYWRVKGAMEYSINSKVSAVFEGYLIDRNSNNTNVSTNAFRSYANSYIGLGIRYQF